MPTHDLLRLNGQPSELHREMFTPVRLRFDVAGALQLGQPGQVWIGGRWQDAQATDYLIMGTRGELAMMTRECYALMCERAQEPKDYEHEYRK